MINFCYKFWYQVIQRAQCSMLANIVTVSEIYQYIMFIFNVFLRMTPDLCLMVIYLLMFANAIHRVEMSNFLH